MFDLTGRVAVITGGSSGLGVQFAKVLAEQGADVAIIARRMDKLESVAAEIRKTGRKCLPVQADLTQTKDIQNAVAAVIEEFGKVDILINNAGSAVPAPAEEMTDEQWDFTVTLNLSSVFKTAREFGKEMIKNNYGRIINIASMHGLVGNINKGLATSCAYHATKGGVVNLTRALAVEWSKYGITVNAICPGFFPSELTQPAFESEEFQRYIRLTTPLERTGRDGELNPALLSLAADEAGYTTGSIVVIDGGTTAY
ncbi:Gluconate 5-dehydrogenase [Methanimicrococcus sp. At1]|uniref:Gluconate 5-dehydrogenase n=1 Tax=Methanimicrococcus hacksteinii TaxID=3028293 RepID=A0ABU3VN11_9EURY|nr:SDR family NAD(P)-dependent oxidoreductase [Methanimicrococcus sp. At1]MDV0444740.1 Gluconate 5-dehydrogenase [Methanimicrococcus sp. At1]